MTKTKGFRSVFLKSPIGKMGVVQGGCTAVIVMQCPLRGRIVSLLEMVKTKVQLIPQSERSISW